MDSFIAVHSGFDGGWPWAADHFRDLWQRQGEVGFRRLAHGDDRRLGEVVGEQAAQVRRLACLGVRVTLDCLEAFPSLREATFQGSPHRLGADCEAALEDRDVVLYRQLSEGFWGQSVAECGLALTLCALRRIPQLHTGIATGTPDWDWRPPGGIGAPGQRGAQYSDDSAFTNGTLAGKRVRVVGAGNIGSRYAGFASALGAEVAAWDPFAAEPAFHRAGARREHHLARLVEDAEVFAPMVPLTDSTRGLVTAEHIGALPAGCLVVLVTRAGICDMEVLRRRVLADELSLAADVLRPRAPAAGRPADRQAQRRAHSPHRRAHGRCQPLLGGASGRPVPAPGIDGFRVRPAGVLLGQPVRTLVDRSEAAGSYEVRWDARDQRGAPLSSGIYIARLSYPGGAETRRLLF